MSVLVGTTVASTYVQYFFVVCPKSLPNLYKELQQFIITFLTKCTIAIKRAYKLSRLPYEPRRNKTCLRGFLQREFQNQSPQLQRLARKLKFHL